VRIVEQRVNIKRRRSGVASQNPNQAELSREIPKPLLGDDSITAESKRRGEAIKTKTPHNCIKRKLNRTISAVEPIM
jgi:hypothetical protein